MTPEVQRGREVPVQWAKLKQVADQHAEPRPGPAQAVRAMLGVFLVGLAAVAFVLALAISLDPKETLEPAAPWVTAWLGLGFTAAVVGCLFLFWAGECDK